MSAELTPAEIKELQDAIYGDAPTPTDKMSVHSFLDNVARAKDTTKLGYLKEEEIGMPQLPIRANKELALISEDIMQNNFISDYFKKEAEITTSTSLSRQGFLIKQATVSHRKIEDVTKMPKEKSGWFKKKEQPNELQQ